MEIEYGFAVIPATQENEQRKALDDKIGVFLYTCIGVHLIHGSR